MNVNWYISSIGMGGIAGSTVVNFTASICVDDVVLRYEGRISGDAAEEVHKVFQLPYAAIRTNELAMLLIVKYLAPELRDIVFG